MTFIERKLGRQNGMKMYSLLILALFSLKIKLPELFFARNLRAMQNLFDLSFQLMVIIITAASIYPGYGQAMLGKGLFKAIFLRLP